MSRPSGKSSEISQLSAPPGLFEAVMRRIEYEKQAQIARRRFALALSFAPVIIIVAIPVWQSFTADMVRTGFWQYFSLAFSDFRIVMSDWKDFGLGLLESLPILSTVAFLSVVLGGLLVAKYALKYRKHSFSVS
jgi:hypothetical protein